MLRTFLIGLVATLLSLTMASPVARAQTTPAKPAAPEEARFLLYLLEDFYRDLMPELDKFEGFAARQKTLADDFRRYIEKKNLGDDLAKLYSAYRDLLEAAEKSEVLKEYKILEEKLKWGPRRELRKEWAAKVNANNLAAAERTAAAVLRSSENGDMLTGLFAGFTTSIFEGVRLRNANSQAAREAQQKWADHVKEKKGEYEDGVKQLNKDFNNEFDVARTKQCKEAAKVASATAKDQGWKDAEGHFDALSELTGADSDTRRGDALRTARLIKLRKVEKGEASAEARLEKAKAYLRAVTFVPASSQYNFVRAALYRAAGEEANLASAEQLRSASFFKGTPTDAAPVGVKAWEGYRAQERKDRIDGRTLHQLVLAYAYQGQFLAAHKMLRENPRYWPVDAVFLYDAARICSILSEKTTGKTVAAKLAAKQAAKDSATFFSHAVLAGFQDLKGAAEVRDLERMRTAYKDWFDALVNGQEPPPIDVPVVEATWKYQVTVNGRAAPVSIVKLYSNGRINAPNGKATWEQKGNLLTLRWPDPKAPGGVWVDKCTLSQNGRRLAGSNQAGAKLAGTLVDP
jgi:hypothetical protein